MKFHELPKEKQETLVDAMADTSLACEETFGEAMDTVMLVHKSVTAGACEGCMVLSSVDPHTVRHMLLQALFNIDMQLQSMYAPAPPGAKLN